MKKSVTPEEALKRIEELEKEEQTILLMSAKCYMRFADNFFDRKMDGGVLWQKIKRKMKLQ